MRRYRLQVIDEIANENSSTFKSSSSSDTPMDEWFEAKNLSEALDIVGQKLSLIRPVPRNHIDSYRTITLYSEMGMITLPDILWEDGPFSLDRLARFSVRRWKETPGVDNEMFPLVEELLILLRN